MAKNQKLELTWLNKDKGLIPVEGKYDYMWVDTADPRFCETHTLVYDDVVAGHQAAKEDGVTYSERADLNPQDDNLLVLGESGDLLEALTRVPELREKYVGKVKCVYIDPPFNTAQTFANYEDNLEHSVWLTMMRDRLTLLHELLSEDGSIWVHLDDVENHRMRVLMDEVFGSGNFQAEVVWQKADSGRNDVSGFSVDQDVILVYGKSPSTVLNRMPRTAADNARFTNPDGDEKGIWFSGDRTAPASSKIRQHPSIYGVQHPITGEMIYPASGRCWAIGRDRHIESLKQFGDYIEIAPDLEMRQKRSGLPAEKLREDITDLIIDPEKKDASQVIARARLKDGNWPEFFVTEQSFGFKTYPPEQGQPPRTWWDNDSVGHNRAAKSEIKALFPGQNPFSTPKPERLLERIIHIATDPGDIVLDIFAGSGTTAAVAQKMGRRWVTCELVEDTFTRFTKPRLTKMVNNDDEGGVTFTKDREVKDGAILPDKFDTADMQDATKLLNAVAKDEEITEEQAAAIKAVKKLIATKPSTVRNWRGGGGFRTAHLSPTCFDYDPAVGMVTLTEAATGETLVASVAAQLGVRLTPSESYFDAVRGNQRVVVIEGMVTEKIIDDLVELVPAGDTLLIAATGVDDGARRYLAGALRGSVIQHIPDDLFTVTAGMRQRPGEDAAVTVVRDEPAASAEVGNDGEENDDDE